MMQTQSNLYELSLNSLQELAWYNVEVKRGKRVYEFNIYREGDTISVFYVDQSGNKLTIVSTEEMLKMLVFEEDKKPYRDFVGDAEWILLDGMDTQRGMTRGEEAAFLYLKANVWDKLTSILVA
ncbi:hypothetical protein CN324_29885 [Bacillus anthracis]|uniref:hypothetical protein n=1 Tax=Bacillus tropicus TaxID=2026188 RepID=UPI000BF4AE6C|nr:hypothetical protein [Bacillus tropicus]PET26393.1 hypothetical protein CN518_29300 [Bacillus anthracis]MDE7553717.1 hypothetical protein [Bacillus tropicus]MDE7574289.1 hypothetical protein [Bacillus tropicus]PEZ55977.1 hypothetical protein CN372_29125 [Bacillus anthracis]PFF12532.1 hypothetical protein CN324_29885 [Bacillus anthracis]